MWFALFSRYHTAASLMNLIWGCGIDGIEDRARDLSHAAVHGFMGIGFSWVVFRHSDKSPKNLPLKAPWIQRHDSLELQLVLKNWQAAIDSLTAISEIAEKQNHHPDVAIENYRKLKITVRTHCRTKELSYGQLAEKDILLAQAIEKVPFQLSEKWAKDNNSSWVTRAKVS
jgi:pterin-4a-carbinolamine dehydratase